MEISAPALTRMAEMLRARDQWEPIYVMQRRLKAIATDITPDGFSRAGRKKMLVRFQNTDGVWGEPHAGVEVTSKAGNVYISVCEAITKPKARLDVGDVYA